MLNVIKIIQFNLFCLDIGKMMINLYYFVQIHKIIVEDNLLLTDVNKVILDHYANHVIINLNFSETVHFLA